MRHLKLILLVFLVMSASFVYSQSSADTNPEVVTIRKNDLDKLIRIVEKLEFDVADQKLIIVSQKVIIKEQAQQLKNCKVLETALVDTIEEIESKPKGKFWAWLNGVGVGGAIVAVLVLL